MGPPSNFCHPSGEYSGKSADWRLVAVSSTPVKTAREILQALDAGQLLADRLRQDQLLRRESKFARIGRLWEQRRLLGKFTAWVASTALLIAFLLPSRYASTVHLMYPL